jgi:SH3 domain-containing YSC84-like protein 1
MKRVLFGLILAAFAAQNSFATDSVRFMTARRIRIASEVVANRMLSRLPVPQYVLDHTKCVASLKVVKAGLIWGGEGSTGLVSCRLPDRTWSAPSFLNVGGVNFGFQIGLQFIESVVTFMNDTAQTILTRPTFQVGADLGVAAGPVGAGGGAAVIPNAALLTYSQTAGLYAGATIHGFVLAQGVQRNAEIYGAGVHVSEILRTPGKKAPQAIQPFVEVLERYVP